MQIEIGKVKDWHNPHDESCPHNGDVARDCGCKRPRKKKPYRRVAVIDNGVGHRINPNLIFEIYPANGTIALREKNRKQRFYISASELYSHLMQRAALAHLAARRKARAAGRKARRARK